MLSPCGWRRATRACRSSSSCSPPVAAYALSPIDLIPDFIPILGYVDDLVIVPLGLLLVIRMIPDECWPTSASAPPHRPSNRAAWLGPSP